MLLAVIDLIAFLCLAVQFVIAGFNDVLFLAFVAAGALLLQRQRTTLAGIAVGLALASKQTAWPLLPFYLAYLWFHAPPGRRWQTALRQIAPTVVTASVIILPFLLWSPGAFLDDVVRFASGGATSSYPISGDGLGQLLLTAGVIRTMWDAYPFWLFQFVLGLPALGLLLWWLRRRPTVSAMLLAYAAWTFVLQFSARYFNDSHIGALSVLLLLAYASADGDQT